MALSFFFEKWERVQYWLKIGVLKVTQRSVLSQNKMLEHPSCKILCTDDDQSFCLFIKDLAYSLDIQLETAYSIKEAKEAIEKNVDYDAFIIDGHLPDGSGFELVAWIREKKGLDLPIGFISRIYQDAASFRILKESLKVDYVLEKPIRPSEVHQLLIQICHLTSTPSSIEDSFSTHFFTHLKATYEKTILDKIERLEKLILNLQRHPTTQNLEKLKYEVHKIAGSAGSYGYMAVSDLCKNLELDLIKQIDLAKQGQFDDEWLASLDDFFTQIKLHFQMKMPDIESHTLKKSGLLSSVYLVDEDPAFTHQFAQLSRNLNIAVLIESSHPDQAIEKLLAADFYPQIFLIDAYYVSSPITGYELIKTFYQNNDELTSVIGLMVEAQSLGAQLEALRKGTLVMISKPFSLPLLSLLDQMPFRSLPLHFKILVIDPDLDICRYILKLLKYQNLEVKTLQDPHQFEEIFKTYQPDLVILNIHLVDESGTRLFHRLRKEWKYQGIIVGMLALAKQETDLLQLCYENHIDELLFKPLEAGVLQRKIASLLKKKTREIVSVEQDLKTGLVKTTKFHHYMHEWQKQYEISYPKMLVLFEVAEWEKMNAKQKEGVTEFVSQAFEKLLKKHEIATYLEKGRFALIFQGYDPYFVQLFMKDFLLDLRSDLEGRLMQKKSIHIHGSLALLVKEEGKNLLNRGEELLRLAQQQADEPLCFMVDPSFKAAKEAWMFYDGTNSSLDVLKTLLVRQGFKVRTFSSLEEEQLPQSRIDLPLFILADSFAEAKKVHLLQKLVAQNQIQIPILHLSHLPEKEYWKSFFTGLHYFESPFGLVIILV